MDEKVLYQILQSREDRALKQEEIIAKYKQPIISFTLNIPGPIKDSSRYREIHDLGMDLISNTLKSEDYDIEYMEKINKSTGPEGYFSINIDPLELKKITVKIENEHALGRLFDIDIFDSNIEQIARAELGLGPRKCLICENEAKVCNKAASHSIEELLNRIDNIYNLYFKNS